MAKEKFLRDGKRKRGKKESAKKKPTAGEKGSKSKSSSNKKPVAKKKKKKRNRYLGFPGRRLRTLAEIEDDYNQWNRARTTGLSESELKLHEVEIVTDDYVIVATTLDIDEELQEEKQQGLFQSFLSRL